MELVKSSRLVSVKGQLILMSKWERIWRKEGFLKEKGATEDVKEVQKEKMLSDEMMMWIFVLVFLISWSVV